jgi:hypothetical protein
MTGEFHCKNLKHLRLANILVLVFDKQETKRVDRYSLMKSSLEKSLTKKNLKGHLERLQR